MFWKKKQTIIPREVRYYNGFEGIDSYDDFFDALEREIKRVETSLAVAIREKDRAHYALDKISREHDFLQKFLKSSKTIRDAVWSLEKVK